MRLHRWALKAKGFLGEEVADPQGKLKRLPDCQVWPYDVRQREQGVVRNVPSLELPWIRLQGRQVYVFWSCRKGASIRVF